VKQADFKLRKKSDDWCDMKVTEVGDEGCEGVMQGWTGSGRPAGRVGSGPTLVWCTQDEMFQKSVDALEQETDSNQFQLHV